MKQTMLVQGQSLSTIDKERQFAAAFSIARRIVQLKCAHETYYHFDLNAGSGFNEDFQVPGSPVVFVDLFEEAGIKFEAFFWDRDEAAMTQLERRLRGRGHCHFFTEDNSTFDRIAKVHLNHWSIGSVVLDPNGWLYRKQRTGDGVPPIPTLMGFFEVYRRIDFIANMNVRVYKMMRGNEVREIDPVCYVNLHGIREFPFLFNKKHWLVSGLSSNGHSSFVRAIGRNMRTNDYRAYGWYHYESSEIQSLIDRIETPGGGSGNGNSDGLYYPLLF